MATLLFDKWSACLKGAHSIFNVFIATLLLLIFELKNPASPFSGPLFNIQALMAASFLYYVIMLAVMISGGIQVTSPFRCFLFELIAESTFSLTQSLLHFVYLSELRNLLIFSYIALFFINTSLHLSLRRRIKTYLSEEDRLLRALHRAKLNLPQIQKIHSEMCSICLNAFTDGRAVVALPCETRHHFHLECIQEWLKENRLCPLCRGSVASLANPLKRRKPNVTIVPE